MQLSNFFKVVEWKKICEVDLCKWLLSCFDEKMCKIGIVKIPYGHEGGIKNTLRSPKFRQIFDCNELSNHHAKISSKRCTFRSTGRYQNLVLIFSLGYVSKSGIDFLPRKNFNILFWYIPVRIVKFRQFDEKIVKSHFFIKI